MLCKNSGIKVISVRGANDFNGIDLAAYDCIVDALLGTGFKGTVRKPAADIIRLINDSDAFVVSVDIPSGLGADGTAPEGETVIADRTVTIGLPKLSLVTYPGKEYTGELHVADIGFPRSLIEAVTLKNELIDCEYLRRHSIPEIESEQNIRADAYKGERGHLLLIGGFDGMEGAIMMTARAAFEIGTGLVTLLTTAEARSVIAGRIPELITISVPFSIEENAADPGLIRDAVESVFERKKFNALVIGPGMGRTDVAQFIFESVITRSSTFGVKRVLIDGDGLFHLAAFIKEKSIDRGIELIVTPHFMEASRIMGLPLDEIKNNRHASAGALARKLSCTALLKGPASIVTDGESFLINTTGSAALATAGSGDVLSGIIGALMMRRLTPLQSAAYGAWIHGRASDLYCAEHTSEVLKSTDLLDYIRTAKRLVPC